MSTRTYGALRRTIGGGWELRDLEPHVSMKLKAMFPKIPQAASPPFLFSGTPEAAADLAWFTQRYPLAANDDDRRALRTAQRAFEAQQAEVSRILSPGYAPPVYSGLRADPQTGEPYVVRPYQAQAVEMLTLVEGLLLGDEVGLGKTYTAAAAFLQPGALPGVVVCARHLQRQWVEVIERFTTLSAAYVRTTKPYPLPAVDVRVFSYSQLAGWADAFELIGCGLVAFDEVQDLRTGVGTEKEPIKKGQAAMRLAKVARRRLGLSATPIYNYGDETFNILEFLSPGLLGSEEEFRREWCTGKQVKQPKALGTYLREQRCFLRRTKADIGQQLPPVNRIVDIVEHDGLELKAVEDVARELARKAVNPNSSFHEKGEATRMLDLRLRHATGMAKARAVASVVRVLVEGGEPVVLVGWHRSVYDLWNSLFRAEGRDLDPAWFTGTESAAEKAQAVERFVSGKTDLFVMSLRAGAGLDGLQRRCSTMVFGELDWSPGIHHQCVGRLDREGQAQPVTALFLCSDDGSDPPMMDVLGLKASQASQIVDPNLGVQRVGTDGSHLRKLVERYLHRTGARMDGEGA